MATKRDSKRSRIPGYRIKYRPGRRKPWIVIQKDESGRHREVGYATEDEAVKALKVAESNRLKYGEAVTTFSPADFAELNEARRILAGEKVTLPEVALFWRDHAKRGCPTITIAEAVATFLKEKEGHGISERHFRDLRNRLKPLVATHGRTIVSKVDSAFALAWVKARGGKPRTMKNNLLAFMNWANFAVRRGWTDKAPAVHESDLPKIVTPSKGVLSVAEARALFDWLATNRPEWCAFFALQAFAGVRRAEAERFRWEWVDFTRRRITIPKEICKTGDDWVMVALPENLWSWLSGYTAEGRFIHPSHDNRDAMRRELFKTGVMNNWPKNALRHSFATYHISEQESADKTALITRHRSAATLWRNYLRALVAKEEAAEYFRIVPEK